MARRRGRSTADGCSAASRSPRASQGVTVFRLTAGEVADVAEFLQAQSLDALLGAFGQDGREQLGCAYPFWDYSAQELQQALDDYVGPSLQGLTGFFGRAADRGMAMLKMLG
ncbi:MAG: DUF1877 family protein [Streptosporangiaceae bacterium]